MRLQSWVSSFARREGLCLLFVWLGVVTASLGADGTHQILVKYRGDAHRQAARPLPAGVRALQSLPLEGWQVMEVAAGMPVRQAMDRLRDRPEVEIVEANHRYQAHGLPNDPDFARLYGLERIGASAAWDIRSGAAEVVVGIFDTGLDLTHPDLVANLWTNPGEIPGNGRDDDGNGWVDDAHGVDLVEGDGDPTDDAGHGTHVAGTIGAVGNNGQGVAGVAWSVQLMPVRVLSADGSATTVEIVKAFDYAVRMRRKGVNLRVINCSWGGGFPSAALREAMEAAGSAGILVVCSAGNDGNDTDALPVYPAGYDVPEILTVGASTVCDEPTSFSNYGRTTVDLAAPGSGVLSTYRGGGRYAILSGTSMAAPLVSGAAALICAERPAVTVAELKALLMGTVDTVPSWEGKSVTGGRLNLGRALQRARSEGVPRLPAPEQVSGRMAVVSRAASGRWGNGRSFQPAISADGRWVAFVSAATNLVRGDSEGWLDVFLHDRRSNTVVRVSQLPNGTGANGDSESPSVSADGRYVAFVSEAANLAAGDLNGTKDVFLWDRNSGVVELVSVRSDGRASGNSTSEVPVVSADGQVVAFASDATDLVNNDRNQARDVFVRDRAKRSTERVSVGPKGVEGGDWSDAPAISGDGRLVVFHSSATNLVAGDVNGKWDVYLRNRTSGATERASGDVVGDDDSLYPQLSADGRWVAFSSAANTFGGGPTGGKLVVQVYDRERKLMVRAGALAGGAAPAADTYAFGISRDGRFVTLTSDDPGLAPGGELGFFRTFLFDRLRGVLETVALSDAGYLAEDGAFYAPVSGDGRYVAFVSSAFGLVPGDGNGVADVFVMDRGAAVADLAARTSGSGSFEGRGIANGRRPQRASQDLGTDGSVEYEVELANGGAAQTFVIHLSEEWPGWRFRARESVRGTDITLALRSGQGWTTPRMPEGSTLVLRVEVSRRDADLVETVFPVRVEAWAEAGGPVLDGVSLVTTVRPGAPVLELVSRGADGYPAARAADGGGLSGDGGRVVFSSEADHLDARGDLNIQSDVFVADRSTGKVDRVSDASATTQGNADSRYPSVSADGMRVAFQSRADNLVAGDANQVEDIFVKDLATGTLRLASLSTAGAAGNRGSESAHLSGDGRFVAYVSFASNLVDGDSNRAQDVFVRDLQSGTTECVSRAADGSVGDADSESPSITRDGRFVVFMSWAQNLVAGDGNGYSDIYLWDRVGRTMELVSANADRKAGNGPSLGASVSDDGRWVAFTSYASDLSSGASGLERRSYLLDRSNRRLRRVEDVVGSVPDGFEIRGALISPGGQSLAVSAARACGLERSVSQVLVWDMTRGRLDTISKLRGGALGDATSVPVQFSADGSRLLFASSAGNLAVEAGYPAQQLYVADLSRAGVDALVRSPGGWRGVGAGVPVGGTGVPVAAPAGGANVGTEIVLRIRNNGNIPDRFVIRTVAGGEAGVRVRFSASPRIGVGMEAAGEVPAIGAAVVPAPFETPLIGPGEVYDLVVTLAFSGEGKTDVDVPIEVVSKRDDRTRDWIRVVATLDGDADGLPDAWERRYFGGLGAGGVGTDGDGDGVNDLSEWLLGGDPTNPRDGLRMVVTLNPENRTTELRWTSIAGVRYRVEASSELGAGFAEVPGEALVGTGSELVWRESSAPSGGFRFYRIRAETP